MSFNELVISQPSDLIFGHSPKPLLCGRGVHIGNGQVFPEINFTLPSMVIDEQTWPEVHKQYTEMIEGVCQRAVELQAPAIVVEFELLPPMTMNPEWGAQITELLARTLDRFHDEQGLKSALRITPVDVRDNARPPRMRSGHLLETTLRSFELCAAAGADLLAIESTGGKELHDRALVQADLAGILYALGVLAVRDMDFLWSRITEIARKHHILPSGDTACAFANTAMILADKGMIPRVLAAAIRVASVVRSLEAYYRGAVGPSKDCAYEGPFIKAITGVPISMEGRSSAGAHLSAIGNIAGACCDLWSNETIQNVRLLSTDAPVVSLEQLVYDCRLMNTAAAEGRESIRDLQRWLVESDARFDPQAFVLRPDIVIALSRDLIKHSDPLDQTRFALEQTLTILRQAHQDDILELPPIEQRWLDILSTQLETVPEEEEALEAAVQSRYGAGVYLSEDYTRYEGP
jgi:methanol--5-hydroxybenzimidazolylcobamide Co-methyltransferase